MAKKPPRTGGRVTPKGTQPAPSKSSQAPSPKSTFDHLRKESPASRFSTSPVGPSRAGRRGGNR